jgi:DNA excision repair protein ERCC-4
MNGFVIKVFWSWWQEVLEEIEEERQSLKPEGSQNAWGEGGAAVLVACKDERMCLQLQDVLARGPQKLMQDEWTKYLLSKAELHGMRTRNKRKPAGYRGVSVTGRGGSRVPWEGEGNQSWVQSEQRQEQDAIMAAAAEVASLDREVINIGEDISHTRGLRARGRGRGRSKARDATTQAGPKKGRGAVRGRGISCAKEDTLTSSGKCNTEVTESVIENQDNLNVGINNPNPQVPDMDGLMNANGDRGLEEEQRKNKPIPPVHFYALESEQRILEVVRPVYVVVYDPDMSFVREMEVYKSENPGRHLKVYFLFYEDSTEGRKFEASIRRENSAFENLIRQKASMMIPVDQVLKATHRKLACCVTIVS